MSYKQQAEELGIKVDGRWSEERIKQEILTAGHSIETPSSVEGIVWEESEISPQASINRMNNLARRIFDGQGSIPDIERVQRIVNSLRDKGYSEDEISQLDLPIENLSKYLG